MTPTQRAAIEKAAELFSRQALGISAWGMTEAHEMTEALRAALAEPAVEPVGYVRMLNGEPTPDDNGYVFSYGKNPYRDTYGDEEWLPVFTAPQAQQPAQVQKCGYDETTGNCTRNPCCGAAPVQGPAKKGLFVDLIAQHPGLAENLMAIDAVPLPEWKPPPRLTDADVNKIYNKWVMGDSDGTTFTDAIQTAVRKQFGVNVEAAPQASESVLTNASAQQPAPPADVPLLTPAEIEAVQVGIAVDDFAYDLVRRTEQLVRQRAGLK